MHVSVELTCGCQPEFGADAAMNDLLRQLRTTLGCRSGPVPVGATGSGLPRIYGIDIAAGADKVVRTS